MFKSNILVAMIMILLAGASVLSAQDITGFEVVDNESVGLPVAPIEKYGVAVAEIDRNGYPDIFCIRWASPGYSRIYINQGGIFQDITDQSPLEQIEAEGQENYTRGALWVDYDNDGELGPGVFPVLCQAPWGVVTSDRVFVSASQDAACTSIYSLMPFHQCDSGDA